MTISKIDGDTFFYRVDDIKIFTMQIQGKALFNLLKISLVRSSFPPPVKPWQVEDYRKVPTDALLKRLKQIGIHLKEGGVASLLPSQQIVLKESNESMWRSSPR